MIGEKYARWEELTRTLGDLGYALRMLDWDAKVMMPSKGISVRSRSHRHLAGVYHEMSTSPEYVQLMEDLHGHPDLNQHQTRTIEVVHRLHQRRIKLPKSFVQQATSLYAEAYQAWLKARESEDAKQFLPYLEKIVRIKQEEVELAGYSGDAYEYFTSYFEPGLTLAELDRLFEDFEKEVLPISEEIVAHSSLPLPEFTFHYPPEDQMAYCQELIRDLGFDDQRGRLDLSEHPFTSGMTANDVRITTRVRPSELSFSVWATLHELGHALYEQHLPTEHYGLPASLPASFGVHESQARFWENHIGRNPEFWQHRYKRWVDQFPAFTNVPFDTFMAHVNRVRPNLIRTEADEMHYHFHVKIRFDLEKMLINGQLQVHELEEKWAEMHRKYFHMAPEKASKGFLQDMHWAQGQWGYFPSYSVGSFLAAQLAEALDGALPGYASEAGQGHTRELLNWLDQNIYQHGKMKTIQELAVMASGKPLSVEPYARYIRQKYHVLAPTP